MKISTATSASLLCRTVLLFCLTMFATNTFAASILSTGKDTFASSVQSSHSASLAVDGDEFTRWSSNYSDDQWIYIDLGASALIEEVVLAWETAYGSNYEIRVSEDGVTWTTIYTENSGDGDIDQISDLNVSARYIGLWGSKRATRWGYSLYSFEVYGEFGEAQNLAAGQPVVASSSKGTALARYATDGDSETRWSSAYNDDESIYVDLGSICYIDKLILNWETAYGAGYKIGVSDDGSNWTYVYTETAGDGDLDEITLSEDITGRYVGVFGTERGTRWGYSLWEMEIYGSSTGDSGETTSVAQVSTTDKPTLATVGWSGTLTKSSIRRVKEDGAVLENLDLSRELWITAENVTVRNCRIDVQGLDYYGIKSSAKNVLIENVEIMNARSSAIMGSNFIARNLYIHDIGTDGIKPYYNFTIENSIITGLGTGGSSTHADGIQVPKGTNGIIRNNHFDLKTDPTGYYNHHQCILMKASDGPIKDMVIDGNWFNGCGTQLQLRGKAELYGGPDNITVTNNKFNHDSRGATTAISGTATYTWSNNIYEDNGEACNR